MCAEHQQAGSDQARAQAVARIVTALEESPQHMLSIDDSYSALTKLAQLGTTIPLESAIDIAKCALSLRQRCLSARAVKAASLIQANL